MSDEDRLWAPTPDGIDLVLDLPRGNATLEHDKERGRFLLTIEGSLYRFVIPDSAVQAWLSIYVGCNELLERLSQIGPT